MRIVSDARRVLILSYSLWAQILGLAALLLPEAAFALWGVETAPYFLWWVGVGLLLFGIVGRLVVQTGGLLANLARIAAVAALILGLSYVAAPPTETETEAEAEAEAEALAIAVPFVEAKEGMRLEAYRDIVDVPTICAGTTRGVTMGMRKSLAECRATLRAEVAEYRRGWLAYVTAETRTRRLTPHRETAFTSLAINVGIAGAGTSTATRRLNGGDIRGACDAITWWTKAGGRVIRGLVIRRSEERALCLVGV